jgi:hypothetical protein
MKKNQLVQKDRKGCAKTAEKYRKIAISLHANTATAVTNVQ